MAAFTADTPPSAAVDNPTAASVETLAAHAGNKPSASASVGTGTAAAFINMPASATWDDTLAPAAAAWDQIPTAAFTNKLAQLRTVSESVQTPMPFDAAPDAVARRTTRPHLSFLWVPCFIFMMYSFFLGAGRPHSFDAVVLSITSSGSILGFLYLAIREFGRAVAGGEGTRRERLKIAMWCLLTVVWQLQFHFTRDPSLATKLPPQGMPPFVFTATGVLQQ